MPSSAVQEGRSMLVAAIMDIVTSNCDDLDKKSVKSTLPKNAEMRDIAAAIEVIEEGALHMDGNEDDDDDNGDDSMKGIGIKILEGTTVLGLARTSEPTNLEHLDVGHSEGAGLAPKKLTLQHTFDNSVAGNLSSAVVPGLWDDLHCEHVAVPFAAWALANWALASEENRWHIQELDQDGHAVMTALGAPERSVKWHGSLVACLLLEDRNLPLNDSVPEWSSSLLSTIYQASKNEDIPLALVALSAFLVSVERSSEAQRVVMEKGLHLLRDIVKRTAKHKQVQEALAKALDLLSTGNTHLSLEESQRWSAILLQWVCGRGSSDMVRSSATKVLSRILEDYGPYSVPISQGWLAILLSEILGFSKASSVKGKAQPKSDKVKNQIDQSNMVSAGQIANQLAGAVVGLAGNQLEAATESLDTLPLADLLSIEPFVGPSKNFKKDARPRISAADSALATLKGIKALTELCVEDVSSQDRVTEYGVLHLLRRFLLCDDYEKLAAIEAYDDASRATQIAQRISDAPAESSLPENNEPSNARVPPTGHIRKHAARFLTFLSLLPKVREVIAKDDTWCRWLEDCANGKIPGCNDLKLQSYARATLLNVLCNDEVDKDSSSGSGNAGGSSICPRYSDMIFLINPELPHWQCSKRIGRDAVPDSNSSVAGPNSENFEDSPGKRASEEETLSRSGDVSHSGLNSELPPFDVIFVHGLQGGPFKSWRIADDKTSTKSGLVERIDQEAGKQGTFWPGEWLSTDFPEARLYTLKYKTNLTQWSGATLPLQEVSSMLLQKLVAAGIGDRPVVFITHSMGGLVVKQMLHKAMAENIDNLVKNTVGVVFYSCPHFGSKLADMPWRMGLVLRPAPTIGELRSGSPRLIELNDFIRQRNKKGLLDVLSFCETKVTPIVEGYGGWAFRMEIVSIESAYPGFGELVVLESTDHINSCKPVNRSDPSYTETLDFLRKLKAQYT
ncbi:uncharacterized protein LOC115747867 isoform X2 [Rhodamnia argentea]|uniref:Uncharacterized protein LOC115747867 isoform X2 n=1 Tax=Rhodamnia argentea TaxID=178133 RepID=A0A8B8PZ18_9MYRT|nr:uncharacterized protein LOC115747867 isoform X2 [Rhodamnia argentea]